MHTSSISFIFGDLDSQDEDHCYYTLSLQLKNLL